jgi:type I restriction enzyme S subunit
VKYPAYLRYKPSGVEYLGDVPTHWEVKRGRFCMRVNPSADQLKKLGSEDEVSFIPMDAVGEYGGLNLEVSRPISDIGSGYTQFQDGDVIVAKITPCFENGKGALAYGLVNGAAFGTTELHVLRALPSLEARFLFYLTISSIYRETGEAEMYGAGGQKRVPPEFNKDFRTPLPPTAEQRTIADFLDRQTAKLDTLIAKKRALIERLKAKRTALISRTVTHGLPPEAARAAGFDPQPNMKESEIEWLGEIPEHWEAKRLKFVSPFITVGIVVEPSKYYVDSGIPALRSLNVKPHNLITDDLVFISPESNEVHAKSKIFEGDLVAVRSGQPGTTAIVDKRFNEANCIDLIIIRKPTATTSEFLDYFLNSEIAKAQFESGTGGAIQQHFNVTTAGSLRIICPPLPEQQAIAAYLDRETAKLDALATKVEQAIKRLQDYRTALITAAVTGKIDVRRSEGNVDAR